MKKGFLLTILIFIAIIFGILTHYNTILNAMDISTQTPTKCKFPGKTWLISYADGSVYPANQNALAASSLNNCIDYYKNYGLHSIDTEYLKKHSAILSQKRGAGYWLWKPYMILKTLKEIPENELLLYVDSGAMIKAPIDGLIEYLGDSDILLVESDHLNRGYIKRDLLKAMNMDNTKILDSTHLQAGFLLIKNSRQSQDFIKKWLELSENEHYITDTPSLEEYPDFLDHRHDQAILSLLRHSEDKNIKIAILDEKDVVKYFFLHRRRNINDFSPIREQLKENQQ